MRTHHMLALAGVAVFSGPIPRSDEPGLSRVRWLAGCWETRQGTRTGLEMWMPPAGGLMMGASRTVADGTVAEWERLQLTETDGVLVYTSLPSGQSEASFTSTQVTDSGFTVENLRHDFPQRISYARRGADSLIARIEGPGRNGVRAIDFPMKRVPCEVGG